MDITKKLYVLAIFLVAALGFFAYHEGFLTEKKEQESVLRREQISQSLQRVIKADKSEKKDNFLAQVPDMRVASKYRAVKDEEKKEFNVKRRKDAQKINIDLDLGEDDGERELKERNERIKNVQALLSPMKEEPVPPLPEGFFSAKVNPYLMYREYYPLTDDFKALISTMHTSFLKKVAPFSLLTNVKRIFMMIFKTRGMYSAYTKRPDWSGGSADVMGQSIYLMEGVNFKSNFMHELTHIYYDGFFEPSSTPRWLSEGFAVYVQSLYQTPQENEWLNVFRLKFAKEEYIDFEDFLSVKTLDGYDKPDVAMWYAQSYTVVKFLFEHYGKDGFYQFSKNLKEGQPLGRAMFRAYGMPLNSDKALEIAWQSNLRKKMEGAAK